MTRRVRARPGNVDTGLEQIVACQRRHRRRSAGTEQQPEEDMAVRALRAAMAQIVEQRLTDHDRQREGGRVACLPLRDRQTLTLPVDVVEREHGDLATTQTVGDEQQQDRVVPPARLGPAINDGKSPVDVLPPRSTAGCSTADRAAATQRRRSDRW